MADRESIIVEMVDSDGVVGLGECVAFSSPWYTEETVQTCWDALVNWLIPALVGKEFTHPSEVSDRVFAYKRESNGESMSGSGSMGFIRDKKGVAVMETSWWCSTMKSMLGLS